MSQIVPINFVTLMGVLSALIFSVALAGANPNMNSVRDKPRSQQIFWDISGPRWALEAFYVNSIVYYQNVPSGAYAGQPYQNVIAGLSAVGYDINNYLLDIKGMFWDGVGWSLLALLIMLITSRDRKL